MDSKKQQYQRDFTNVAEKDCVRLIIAQDLKEFGIDVDANLGGGLGNLTSTSSHHRNATINTSSQLNGTASSHFAGMHNHSLTAHHCATLGSNLKDFITSSKHHNKSNISTNLISDHHLMALNCAQHDSQLSGGRVFNLNMNQLETASVTVIDQTLSVPM